MSEKELDPWAEVLEKMNSLQELGPERLFDEDVDYTAFLADPSKEKLRETTREMALFFSIAYPAVQKSYKTLFDFTLEFAHLIAKHSPHHTSDIAQLEAINNFMINQERWLNETVQIVRASLALQIHQGSINE